MANFQEEPSLFDIFLPLINRWKLMITGIVISLLAGVLLSALTEKQYKTALLIQIGAVFDKQLEDANTVVEIINSESFSQTISNKMKLADSRHTVKMIKAETNQSPGRPSPLVAVTVASNSPEHTIEVANAVFALLSERHKPMFDQKMIYYTTYEKQLEEQLKSDEMELSSLRRDLDVLNQNPKTDLSTKILLQTRIGDLESQSLTAKRELRELLAFTSAVHSHPTATVAKPIVPARPWKPNVKLILTIAFFAGSFLMISFILILDQYRKTPLRIG